MKKFTLILSLCFISFLIVNAQESINSGSEDAYSGNTVISYTIGQAFHDHIEFQEGSITSGIQQSYDISVVSSNTELKIDLEVYIYPNPFTDYFNLSFPEYNTGNYIYNLYNSLGEVIISGEIQNSITSFDIQTLKPEVYLLSVTDNAKVLKTFKVVKK